MSTIHISVDTPALQALKGFCVGTTLYIAGSMTTTSLQFIPSLLVATQQQRPSLGRQASSGRLTPVATPGVEKQIHLSPAAAIQGKIDDSQVSSRGYKLAAQQFSLMSKTAFVTQVPFELLTIAASGYLAYNRGNWNYKWAAVAGLVAAVFPLTGGLMVPLDHKIARLAGEEPAIEPYEDMPPDREMERGNAEGFLRQWNVLNTVRSGMMLVAGGVGVWSILERGALE